MFINRSKMLAVLTMTFMVGATYELHAGPNITSGQRPTGNKGSLRTTASCRPAEAGIDLDINNVRAKLMTGGDMWWDIGTGEARYEVPKGSRKNSLFAGSVWIGGIDQQGQLKVAAQTYRQDGNDYWPGPLNTLDAPGTTTIDASVCSDWDKFWKVDKTTINKFRELQKAGNTAALDAPEFDVIWQWPARGNGFPSAFLNGKFNGNPFSKKATGNSGQPLIMDDREYAPFVNADVPNNPADIYNPELGDYPGVDKECYKFELPGDQYIWWVFNDRGNIKQQTNTEAIGVEVQAAAFGYARKDNLNDATFYEYKLINRSTNRLDSTFIATWTDADLGFYRDDYIGCDPVRGLGILYNGRAVDGNGEANSYGAQVPMIGIDFFRGPIVKDTLANGTVVTDTLGMEAFTYYNNNNDAIIGNPSNGIQIYYYMTGSLRNGQPFVDDRGGNCTGTTTGPATKVVFTGDPSDPSGWSECQCSNPPDDRRFIHSSGPFTLLPGDVNDITIAAVWVSDAGGCPNASFRKIRAADDLCQQLFDNCFTTIEGPEAPQLVIREMNRKLICYLVNPENSNNYKEQFGSYTGNDPKKFASFMVASPKARNAGVADSLSYYKFEGYRVFQLRDGTIGAAQVLNERGEVNTEVAREVFQTDIQNGVKQIVNFDRVTNIVGCDSCYQPVVKVTGKDSGVVHSFVITQDAFATGQDKGLVNYKNYYFLAIAYAHNNFRNFSSRFPEITQDIAYLESEKAPGGTKLLPTPAMPNPANGDFGTVVGADYGDGVIIKRLAGIGNGGVGLQAGSRDIQLSKEAEEEALSPANGFVSKQPTYAQGRGPVDIRVVDPRMVKPGNWELYIVPDSVYPEQTRGVIGNRTSWLLVNTSSSDTIYSERKIDVVNEQILQKYGFSVNIQQVSRPGDVPDGDNGYITSDITFENPSLAWLGGLPDGENRQPNNWIRSGTNVDPVTTPCDYSDNDLDKQQRYENMLANNSNANKTWAPYALGSSEDRDGCGFGTVFKSVSITSLSNLMGVDIVLTSDRSKWSRSVVLEIQDNSTLAQNGVSKFGIRSHKSWTGDVDATGAPVYGRVTGDLTDTGMSWFPGYAINQETGERLNIIFTEDSWLRAHNGTDLLWNPTNALFDDLGNSVFGGRHYIYISNTKYDSCKSIVSDLTSPNTIIRYRPFRTLMWVGIPTVVRGFSLLPARDGFIPTTTRLRFRVTRPYARYIPVGVDTSNGRNNRGYPYYSFSTDALVPRALADNNNPYKNDKQKLLDMIQVVPNPYYAYSAYEGTIANGPNGRLDTRVRIINLPKKATVNIYSLDGALIRRLEKDNPDQSYIDWDVRNAKSLQIASGMYLVHVQADGIGETIIRWFGAMRPTDAANY